MVESFDVEKVNAVCALLEAQGGKIITIDSTVQELVRAYRLQRQALEYISEGWGRFSRDPSAHARNVVTETQIVARGILEGNFLPRGLE